MKKLLLQLLIMGSTVLGAHAASENLAGKATVAASSELPNGSASNAVDGVASDSSRWLSKGVKGIHTLTFSFPEPVAIGGVHLYSGFEGTNPVEDFRVEYKVGEKWEIVPSANIEGNTETALRMPFDGTVDVKTDGLRLVISETHQDIARIQEVTIWPAADGGIPPIGEGVTGWVKAVSQSDIPVIYLNQAGFNTVRSKRFTAPTLPDGTPFQIRPVEGGEAAFEGKITGHIGDFSKFETAKANEWIIEAGGEKSVPFAIEPNHLERTVYQNALNFMIDSRHHVGTFEENCRGSFGWRDDHHFGWELSTLVPQFLSNPSAWKGMKGQVSYVPPTDRKLWGALEPYSEDAPDIVKLIHWAADICVTQKLDHATLKSELAFFLYAWPLLKEWLPAQNYEAVSDYALSVWEKPGKSNNYPYDETPGDGHNLLKVSEVIGSTKGSHPPGFTVEPNLLMYEVAKREGQPDADRFLDAAIAQVEWLIENLDWENPLHTKGQRMSEHRTIPGMALLLRLHPDKAPAGLRKKISSWADVVIRRSDNLWDFRKLTDDGDWTPSGEKPNMWNEAGNVLGLPACLFAAVGALEDGEKIRRLEEIAWAHLDNSFGRNPTGRHFSYDAPREIEGVEFGWFNFHKGGIGQLEAVRFVFDGSPKREHYPYHPEVGDVGWTEGWIQFNTAFNLSLAYLAMHETQFAIEPKGDKLVISLRAPLNFDSEKVENAEISLSLPSGQQTTTTLTESGSDSGIFQKTISRPNSKSVSLQYGFGAYAKTRTVEIPR